MKDFIALGMTMAKTTKYIVISCGKQYTENHRKFIRKQMVA